MFRTFSQSLILLNQRFLSTNHEGTSRLDRILKLDKVVGLPAEEVRKLWLLHHRSKPFSLSSVVSPTTYDKLSSRGKESPFFVLPLPELSLGEDLIDCTETFTNFVSEFRDDSLLFTSHAEYLRMKSQAIPHLSVQFFPELRASHDLVLMAGEVTHQKPTASVVDAAQAEQERKSKIMSAQYLLNLWQLCMLDDKKYHQLVWIFNHQPHRFSFEILQREIASLPDHFQKKLTQDPSEKRE